MGDVILNPSRNYIVIDADDLKVFGFYLANATLFVGSLTYAWYRGKDERKWRKEMKKQEKVREEARAAWKKTRDGDAPKVDF